MFAEQRKGNGKKKKITFLSGFWFWEKKMKNSFRHSQTLHQAQLSTDYFIMSQVVKELGLKLQFLCFSYIF